MMRNYSRFKILSVFGLCGITACSDAVLSAPPEQQPLQREVQGTRATQGLLLDPVVVTVPQCDPYMELSGCETEGENSA
jgi:hypothetical protein